MYNSKLYHKMSNNNITIVQSFIDAIFLKFLKVMNLTADDFSPENVEKIEKVLQDPKAQAALKNIINTYIQIAEPLVKPFAQKVMLTVQETIKESGQSMTRLIVDLIPILGSIILGVDSATGAVSHAAEGVNNIVDLVSKSVQDLNNKIKVPNVQMPNVQMPNVQMPNVQMPEPNIKVPSVNVPSVELPTEQKGGLLLRSKKNKTRRKFLNQKGGSYFSTFTKKRHNIISNAIQILSSPSIP